MIWEMCTIANGQQIQDKEGMPGDRDLANTRVLPGYVSLDFAASGWMAQVFVLLAATSYAAFVGWPFLSIVASPVVAALLVSAALSGGLKLAAMLMWAAFSDWAFAGCDAAETEFSGTQVLEVSSGSLAGLAETESDGAQVLEAGSGSMAGLGDAKTESDGAQVLESGRGSLAEEASEYENTVLEVDEGTGGDPWARYVPGQYEYD